MISADIQGKQASADFPPSRKDLHMFSEHLPFIISRCFSRAGECDRPSSQIFSFGLFTDYKNLAIICFACKQKTVIFLPVLLS